MFLILLFIICLACVIVYTKKQDKENEYQKYKKEKFSNLSQNINVEPDVLSYKEKNTKEYKIAGVTFENENGKDIQKEIKKILREYISEGLIDKEDMYGGYTNSEIKEMDIEVSQFEDISFNAILKEATFENQPCVKVYMERADKNTYTHVGYIPKRYNQIQEVIGILHNNSDINLELYVVGGKIKQCETEIDDDYEEKITIETIELDYGLRLYVEYK